MDESIDQRRHRRVASHSKARVNFDNFWHECPVNDLSGGGASFRSWLQPPVGSNVLVQIRALGVIRARVVRRWEQGFAVAFNVEDYDAGALVDNLTLTANPDQFGPASADPAARSEGASAQNPASTRRGKAAADATPTVPNKSGDREDRSHDPDRQDHTDPGETEGSQPLRAARRTMR